MVLLSLLSLALAGSLARAEQSHDSVSTAGSMLHASSSVVDAPPSDASLAAASAETTASEFLKTLTHTMTPDATALPDGGAPKLSAEGHPNATLREERRSIEAGLKGADSILIEVRNDRYAAGAAGADGVAATTTKKVHHWTTPREWIWCHGKGYDPWVDDNTIQACLWDKANGEGDGKWTCDNRMMYMIFQLWGNRTEAVRGCWPCFTWCYGRKHSWCDCTEQSDLHTTKVWMGWGPLEHWYTKGWQNSFTQYASTTYLGQLVGTSFREKRAEPSLSAANASSMADVSAMLEPLTGTWANGTDIEPSSVAPSSIEPSSIESGSIEPNSTVHTSPAAHIKDGAPSVVSDATVKSHVTPAPKRWTKGGGSPEFHTFTPAANHTAVEKYRSILVREHIIDEQNQLNASLGGDSALHYDTRWQNVSASETPALSDVSTSMELAEREAPPWHWSKHPPQGLWCYSQGYSPQINETLFYWIENQVKSGRTGKYDIDYPYDVNVSIITQFWHDSQACVDMCKDCVAWGIKDNRNLLWCDYRIGWLTSCHVGWEPIDAFWIAKTDWFGDYISSYFPTLTDHWYTTPQSLIMASEWHQTPWLPAVATQTSTHYFVDGTHNAEATGGPPWWDVYCTAAYAGFELSDWQTTHTRTNWDWSGWYTTPTTTPTTPIDQVWTPVTTSSSSGPHVFSTVYPTPRAAAHAGSALRAGAQAVRVNMHADAQDPSDRDACLNSCNPCIDWGFEQRRANVSCIVKPKRFSYVGLCEADFALSLEPTGTVASPLSASSAAQTFTPAWPSDWNRPKIVNASLTFTPVTKTITNEENALETTTEWWAGTTILPAETAPSAAHSAAASSVAAPSS